MYVSNVTQISHEHPNKASWSEAQVGVLNGDEWMSQWVKWSRWWWIYFLCSIILAAECDMHVVILDWVLKPIASPTSTTMIQLLNEWMNGNTWIVFGCKNKLGSYYFNV